MFEASLELVANGIGLIGGCISSFFYGKYMTVRRVRKNTKGKC